MSTGIEVASTGVDFGVFSVTAATAAACEKLDPAATTGACADDPGASDSPPYGSAFVPTISAPTRGSWNLSRGD